MKITKTSIVDEIMLVVFKTNQKDYELILFKTHNPNISLLAPSYERPLR